MELPNYTDYGKILEMNPFAAWQAGQQMDLANTFQQQKLAQEQESARKMQLANTFSEQNNPQLIEKQRLSNLESTYGLPAKKVAGEIAEETAPQVKEKAMKDALLGLDESKLRSMDTQAELWARDFSNPERQKQGLAILQLTPEIRKLQMQHAQQTKLEQMKEEAATRRTGMTIGGQKALEEMRINAGKYQKGQQVKDFTESVALSLSKAKSASDQQAILTRAATMAQQAGELALAQNYQQQADALDPLARRELSGAGTLQRRLEGGQIVSTPRAEAVPSAASQQVAPPPEKYQPGQTYKGKTGTYKFKGGDPADKNSWEKVQ